MNRSDRSYLLYLTRKQFNPQFGDSYFTFDIVSHRTKVTSDELCYCKKRDVVFYKISVKRGLKEWFIERRYSEIVRLISKLKLSKCFDHKIIPVRTWFDVCNNIQYIQNRMSSLSIALDLVLKDLLSQGSQALMMSDIMNFLLIKISPYSQDVMNVKNYVSPSPSITTISCHYDEGSYYEGECLGNKFHGRGKFVFANCDTYIGHFVNGAVNGYGQCLYANGNEYNGDWVANKHHGRGIYRYAGGNEFYEGSWQEGQYHGSGHRKFANGDIYVGNFSNDKFNGNGIYFFADGSVYEGEFQDNKKHGVGNFIDENKESFQCRFFYDKLIEAIPLSVFSKIKI